MRATGSGDGRNRCDGDVRQRARTVIQASVRKVLLECEDPLSPHEALGGMATTECPGLHPAAAYASRLTGSASARRPLACRLRAPAIRHRRLPVPASRMFRRCAAKHADADRSRRCSTPRRRRRRWLAPPPGRLSHCPCTSPIGLRLLRALICARTSRRRRPVASAASFRMW